MKRLFDIAAPGGEWRRRGKEGGGGEGDSSHSLRQMISQSGTVTTWASRQYVYSSAVCIARLAITVFDASPLFSLSEENHVGVVEGEQRSCLPVYLAFSQFSVEH